MRMMWPALLGVVGSVFVVATASADVSFSSTTYLNPTGSLLLRPLTGDFNGDGKPDVVVVGLDHSLSYFEGIGNGQLRAPITTDISAITTDIPFSAVVADFNHDGYPDVAIRYQFNMITVHFADGAGHFSSGVAITTREDSVGLVTGDFDFDGNADLVTAGDTEIWVHRGNGDGTFQAPLVRNVDPFGTGAMVAGNVDNNRGDDLVWLWANQVITWPNLGFNGEALTLTPYAGQWDNSQLALGDLNNDGYPDLVIGSWAIRGEGAFYGTLGTLMGTGFTGQFVFGWAKDLIGAGVALADFNTDGNLDIISGTTDRAVIHKGDGTGQVVPSSAAPLPWSDGYVIDDLDRDGRPDIITWGGGAFEVMLNKSPRGCVDRLALGYSTNTLTIGFTIKTAIPVRWNAWLAAQNSFVPLWSVQIPAVPDAGSFNLPIPGVPPIGNVAILTTMSSDTYGLMCGDWKVVDTGGIGPTAQTLWNRMVAPSLAPLVK